MIKFLNNFAIIYLARFEVKLHIYFIIHYNIHIANACVFIFICSFNFLMDI